MSFLYFIIVITGVFLRPAVVSAFSDDDKIACELCSTDKNNLQIDAQFERLKSILDNLEQANVTPTNEEVLRDHASQVASYYGKLIDHGPDSFTEEEKKVVQEKSISRCPIMIRMDGTDRRITDCQKNELKSWANFFDLERKSARWKDIISKASNKMISQILTLRARFMGSLSLGTGDKSDGAESIKLFKAAVDLDRTNTGACIRYGRSLLGVKTHGLPGFLFKLMTGFSMDDELKRMAPILYSQDSQEAKELANKISMLFVKK